MSTNKIDVLYLSQEDLLKAGCFDIKMVIDAAKKGLIAFQKGDILFPDKIVQIFNDDTQERINCLPSTLVPEKICGVKWVSVFPQNPIKYGTQNLSAVIVLSDINKGFPVAFMEGTLCSNIRVAAMGGIAAEYLAKKDSKVIGFIGSGEQAKMHLVAMKSVIKSLEECRVSSKTAEQEIQFIEDMKKVLPDMKFVSTQTNSQAATKDADIIVTATGAQAPLLKADWMKKGAFYSHIGGWEDEYDVAKQCDKIVCDDWEIVKHRTQTLSRMYKDGELKDEDIYANIVDIVSGAKTGRESDSERIYFNAVGLSYIDISIAYAMYKKAMESNIGQKLTLQESMIFQHENLREFIKL
jgi:ornithine cyclodeaminase/alanine dehydrogenase-like protein (mu-crystallin family)